MDIFRPSARLPQASTAAPGPYPTTGPVKSRSFDSDLDNPLDKKRWSDTQASRTPSRPRRAQSIGPRVRRSTSVSERSTNLSRSNSLSTIDGGHNPVTGAYKVIIEKTEQSRPLQDGAPEMPAIEVPIPHYRLGTPRFSTRGTAFLHSAVYSASSNHDDSESVVSNAEVESLFPLPPGLDANTAVARQQPHAVPELHTVHVNPTNGVRRPIPTSAPIFHRSKEPIVPSIYDAIAANPDNPAIVRYAIMSNREISAASPARIIAQITSKNFLDYELLSDFFLTVRAYLSTHDLLAYLLARFEWAINRFDDDGRVIRVRAFAAIRHWVLNYFPYDFVVDRDLRVKFCTYLNSLSRHVRIRASHEPSDSKLIIDLKKCWNGRCALYWDNPHAENEGRSDLDINPGGIVGSRDSRLTHPSELWAKLSASSSHQLDQEKSVAALHNWVDSVIEAEVDGKAKAERQGSVTNPGAHPTSLTSDQSVQAMSCTIPGRTLKAFAAQSHRNVGPHPVPTAIPPTVRKACPPPPSGRHISGKSTPKKPEHDRSGSFSDALLDKRTSLPMGADKSKDQVVVNVPFSGSLIRGSVFPPGSPFIDNVTSQGSAASLQKQQYARALDGTSLDQRPMSPGVRNLLANIRRAWGSKQNSNAQSASLLSTAPFPAEKNAALPMHIAFKIEGLGDQYHQLEALKKNSRIDLLCADVTSMFERAMTQGPHVPEVPAPVDSIGVASGNEREQPSPYRQHDVGSPERAALTRNHSAMTGGSRSIVIVDDTSSEPPVPALPNEYYGPAHPQYSMTNAQAPFSISDLGKTSQTTDYKTPVPANTSNHISQEDGITPNSELLPEFTNPSLPASPQERQNTITTAGSSHDDSSHKTRPSIPNGKSFTRPNRSDSQSLRKYVSYQSGMRRSGPDNSFAAFTVQNIPPQSPPNQLDRAPGRMLRRRPGGDLRANETVHDMEPIARPKSAGSITAYTDSMHNSLKRFNERNTTNTKSANVNHAAIAEPVPEIRKTLSMIQTQSTHKKDLRPSFEAAVAQFARIPDDDGGDLEATLAKLEGKFRKSPIGSPEGPKSPAGNNPDAGQVEARHLGSGNSKGELAEREPGFEKAAVMPLATARLPKQEGALQAAGKERDTMTRSLYADSEDSYNPVPLLERGATNTSQQNQRVDSDKPDVPVPRPLFSPKLGSDSINGSTHSNAIASDYDENPSIHGRRGRYRSSVPTMTTDSFLLDDDESLSDLSSDLSDHEFESNPALDQAYGSAAQQLGGRSLPPNVEYASGYLPSPPMTTENAMALKSETNRIQEQLKPPTPEPSPVSRGTESTKGRTPGEVDGSVLQPFANKVHQFPPRRHIPFILAFDAMVLAQQLTIIERDALNEINWQDLIDMRWNNASSTTLNWVEYLHFQDPTGIELVTARFNIMVKWAQSEIVLTHNPEERALTIMKFIHIAKYTRKIHNYATMLQLTIAMTSIDCSRLTKTWAIVPEEDKAALKEMEKLVSPLRNFHNLRAEMDAENLEDGCIPVVGTYILQLLYEQTLMLRAALFIHDLTYNAQKPSVIASTRDAEPLINFERHRTTATIVKSLLRLIDASAKYEFRPVEGALERCLWMASLSDEGIRTKSRELEA